MEAELEAEIESLKKEITDLTGKRDVQPDRDERISINNILAGMRNELAGLRNQLAAVISSHPQIQQGKFSSPVSVVVSLPFENILLRHS